MSNHFKPFRAGSGISASHLSAMSRGLFGARGTNGVNVRWERGQLVVEGTSATNLHPFQIIDRSTVAAGWQFSVHPGTFLSANDNVLSGIYPTLSGDALDDVPAPVMAIADTETNIYLHAEFDSNEELDGVPEIVIYDDADPQPTNDFTNAYLLLGSVTKQGDASSPSLATSNEPGVTSNIVHRKINLTNLWGAAP